MSGMSDRTRQGLGVLSVLIAAAALYWGVVVRPGAVDPANHAAGSVADALSKAGSPGAPGSGQGVAAGTNLSPPVPPPVPPPAAPVVAPQVSTGSATAVDLTPGRAPARPGSLTKRRAVSGGPAKSKTAVKPVESSPVTAASGIASEPMLGRPVVGSWSGAAGVVPVTFRVDSQVEDRISGVAIVNDEDSMRMIDFQGKLTDGGQRMHIESSDHTLWFDGKADGRKMNGNCSIDGSGRTRQCVMVRR